MRKKGRLWPERAQGKNTDNAALRGHALFVAQMNLMLGTLDRFYKARFMF